MVAITAKYVQNVIMKTMTDLDELVRDIMSVPYSKQKAKAAIQEFMAYNQKVVYNIQLVAQVRMPAEYVDPVSGKKLYNEASVEQKLSEAQTNAVAWVIGIIDDMHADEIFDGQLGKGSVGDKGYKGIKNRIRDKYKAEVGVDPAPRYPVRVELQTKEES